MPSAHRNEIAECADDAAASDGPPVKVRKRDAEATRLALLEAAKAQFGQLGYDGTSLRDVARAAGVDVALIKRYFGGKEGLFTEALKASLRPDPMKDWDRATFAHDIAIIMAGPPIHVEGGGTHGFQFLLQAATSPTTAALLNVAVQERFLAPIRDWLGGPHAAARARVLAAAFIGFLVERLIRGEALGDPERDVFIDRAAGVFEYLLQP
jgi:AcrR family transcriptional regulator